LKSAYLNYEEILADQPIHQFWRNLTEFIMTDKKKVKFGGKLFWRKDE